MLFTVLHNRNDASVEFQTIADDEPDYGGFFSGHVIRQVFDPLIVVFAVMTHLLMMVIR